MSQSSRLVILFLAAALIVSMFISVRPAQAAPVDIVNNTDKYDTAGNPIWAQGGWIMQEGGTFYWYGMDFSVSGVKKVNLYTSTDLINWQPHLNIVNFESINEKLDAIGDTTTPRFVHNVKNWAGRPLVQYNSALNKYVMLIEWGNDPNRNKLTFFTGDHAEGPFTYEKHIVKPGGWGMGDLGSIFTDDDGQTYISYTTDYNNQTNAGLQISKLTTDFLNIGEITKTFVSQGPFKEATSLFKRNGKYHMLASTTNGWTSSATYCYSASSLSGTWTTAQWCSTSPYSDNSFDTQLDQVLPIQGTAGTVYMYIGDRWNNKGGSTGIGRNQWYPLSFELFDVNGKVTINGHEQWKIDVAAGTWSADATVPVYVDVTQTYTIANRWPGKALGIAGESTADYAKLEQRTANGSASQQWRFIDAGDGYYNIRNVNSGKNLTLSASTAVGAQVAQYSPSSSTSQQFRIAAAGGGYYKLINRGSGLVLGNSGSGAEGAIINQEKDQNQWSQNFSFTVLP
jgi:hypothetical protein